MMNIEIVQLVIMSLSVISMYILIIYLFTQKKSNNKDNTQDNVSKLNLILSQENFIEKVDSILDECIKKASDTYMILNVNYDPEKYLNSKETDQLLSYIFATVKKNMTPEIKSLLGMAHNINTDKDLDELITIKIKIYVIAIVVNKNNPI